MSDQDEKPAAKPDPKENVVEDARVATIFHFEDPQTQEPRLLVYAPPSETGEEPLSQPFEDYLANIRRQDLTTVMEYTNKRVKEVVAKALDEHTTDLCELLGRADPIEKFGSLKEAAAHRSLSKGNTATPPSLSTPGMKRRPDGTTSIVLSNRKKKFVIEAELGKTVFPTGNTKPKAEVLEDPTKEEDEDSSQDPNLINEAQRLVSTWWKKFCETQSQKSTNCYDEQTQYFVRLSRFQDDLEKKTKSTRKMDKDVVEEAVKRYPRAFLRGYQAAILRFESIPSFKKKYPGAVWED